MILMMNFVIVVVENFIVINVVVVVKVVVVKVVVFVVMMVICTVRIGWSIEAGNVQEIGIASISAHIRTKNIKRKLIRNNLVEFLFRCSYAS